MGHIGTYIGIVALIIATMYYFLGPSGDRPWLEGVVRSDVDEFIRILVVSLGFVAVAFGLLGALKREVWAPSGMAFLFGGVAIFVQYLIGIFVVIMVFAIIGYILTVFL